MFCPALEKTVQLRIIYDVGMGKACPVWVDPVFKECLEINDCLLGPKSDKCLLQNANIPVSCMGCV